MTDRHDRGVEKTWKHIKRTLEDGYWQDVFTEKVYYPDYETPVDTRTNEKGNAKGEFDVLAVNYDDQLAMYTEVKSSSNGCSEASKQLERARKYFEDTEWEVMGKKYIMSKEPEMLTAD